MFYFNKIKVDLGTFNQMKHCKWVQVSFLTIASVSGRSGSLHCLKIFIQAYALIDTYFSLCIIV